MKIKIGSKVFRVKEKKYDPYNECNFYYTYEVDEPFCDLCEDIEEIKDNEN